MNPVLIKLIEKGQEPTRTDIAELLAALGKPGENRDEKQSAIRQLFDETGHRATNSQGTHIAEVLDSYEAY